MKWFKWLKPRRKRTLTSMWIVTPEDKKAFAVEGTKLGITEMIYRLMKIREMTVEQLAARLELPSWLLESDLDHGHLSIPRLGYILHALDCELKIEIKEGESNE